jgi:hypothetical protein
MKPSIWQALEGAKLARDKVKVVLVTGAALPVNGVKPDDVNLFTTETWSAQR